MYKQEYKNNNIEEETFTTRYTPLSKQPVRLKAIETILTLYLL